MRPVHLCRGPDTGEFTITAVTACAVGVWPRGAGDGLVEPFPGCGVWRRGCVDDLLGAGGVCWVVRERQGFGGCVFRLVGADSDRLAGHRAHGWVGGGDHD